MPLPWPSNRTWISTWRAPTDEVFEDEPVVVEGCRRLAPRRRDRVGERLGVADRAHALAAAARRRLDQQGKADRIGRGDQRVVGGVRLVVAAEDRDSERRRQPPCRRLVAHDPDRLRWRPDPADRSSEHGLCEIGVLGQEPETGVERIGAGGTSRSDHGRDVEQVERALALRRRYDSTDAEPVARSGDPGRDLAAVGDEQRADRGGRRRPGRCARAPRCHQRVNRVTCDTPTPPNTSGGQSTARDPALDGARRGTDPRGSLAGTQFLGHRCRDRRISELPRRDHGSRRDPIDRASRRVVASR